jgi:hypothetical protein
VSIGAGEVGDGNSVGTGISVGEEGTVGLVLCSLVRVCAGMLAVGGTAGIVGDEGACVGICVDVGRLASEGTGTSSVCVAASGAGVRAGRRTGIRDSSVAARAGVICGGREGSIRNAMLTSSSSSIGAGEVGEGNSVGTGISVGEEGIVGLVRARPATPVRNALMRLGRPRVSVGTSVGASVPAVPVRGGTSCMADGASVGEVGATRRSGGGGTRTVGEEGAGVGCKRKAAS